MERFAIALLLLVTCIYVSSYPPYQHQIPNGQKVQNPCTGAIWDGVGHLNHSGGGPRNKFGLAFAAAGHVWGYQLCMEDSDGDGKSNGKSWEILGVSGPSVIIQKEVQPVILDSACQAWVSIAQFMMPFWIVPKTNLYQFSRLAL